MVLGGRIVIAGLGQWSILSIDWENNIFAIHSIGYNVFVKAFPCTAICSDCRTLTHIWSEELLRRTMTSRHSVSVDGRRMQRAIDEIQPFRQSTFTTYSTRYSKNHNHSSIKYDYNPEASMQCVLLCSDQAVVVTPPSASDYCNFFSQLRKQNKTTPCKRMRSLNLNYFHFTLKD